MNLGILLLLLIILINYSYSAEETNYGYYTSGGIKSGLEANSDEFTLNGKHIRLLSGSLHYFRVPPQYWKDRLQKFRAAGLNAVQLYSPWNLHEETPGNFDFKSDILNLAAFLTAIKEADMFAVFRPGPFICAEWELGGFPAWLLRDPKMNLRSSYTPYLEAVGKYFEKLLAVVKDFQFSTNGGPIIALQIENEYGGVRNQNDLEYLTYLENAVKKSGFKQLLFTSDPGDHKTNPIKNLTGVLETANLNNDAINILTNLKKSQPNKPLFVTEFWPGWFDQWGEKHHTMTIEHFTQEVTDIVFKMNSSINFYMFIGGTNFGFMNGGHVITSYDYNAPLSESGNYTDKYWKARELFEKFQKEKGINISIPKPPEVSLTANYGKIKVRDYLSLETLLSKIKPITSEKPQHMELLNIGSNYGQHFGFILYRTTTNKFKHLKLSGGVSDRGIVLIDHKAVSVVESNKDFNLNTTDSEFSNQNEHTLDIIVENTGRPNIGGEMNSARKGLNGDVSVDDKVHTNYKIYPLQFKPNYIEEVKALNGTPFANVKIPALFRAELDIKDKPRDTFLKLDNWTKGNVFVNGFNIGRYYNKGPQQTLYVPGPFLKTGKNDIFIFELHSAADTIEFIDKPILG